MPTLSLPLVEDALRSALPGDLRPRAAELARALQIALESGAMGSADPSLIPLMEALGGRRIEISGATIEFGAGSQLGDVRIGDVVGRDLVKVNLIVGDRPDAGEGDYRRRTAALLRRIWITGVLERSLHHQTLIALGLNYALGAVDYPWRVEVEPAGAAATPLARPLHELFAAEGRELLILGEPGGGKTTLLLDLARALLAQAEAQTEAPLPLVLNLASWAQKTKPLADWLLDELSERYDVPAVVGRRWLERRQVILLLDGLDEVAAGYQAACVDAINTFRGQYGFAGMAVACRSAQYATIGRQLRLRAAVRLQLLSLRQIDEYLARLGPSFAGLRLGLARDAAVRKLAETPLLLSMMVMLYQGADALDVVAPRSGLSPRQALFERFIDRAFAASVGVYPAEKARRYLAWLAVQMHTYAMTVINERALAFAEEEFYIRERNILGIIKIGFTGPTLWNGLAYVVPGGARLRRGLNILIDKEPWDIDRLLEQAAELGLMRPVHKGYIFIHRLLLDHLAETAPDDVKESVYKKLYRRFGGNGPKAK